MIMNRLLLMIMPGLILLLSACAAETKHYAIARQTTLPEKILNVLNAPETQFLYSTKQIPKGMMAKIKSVSRSADHIYNEEYKLANPGEDFRAGCVIDETHPMPCRRLVFLAKHQDSYVLCYERGGWAHNLLISFSQQNGGKWSYHNLHVHDVADYSSLELIKKSLEAGNVFITYDNGNEVERASVPF